MDKQDRAFYQSLSGDPNEFGFVGYRDYKQSKFFQEYEEARAKLSPVLFAEATGREVKETTAPQKKHGRFAAFLTALLGLVYIGVCICGYFVPDTIEWVNELLRVFRGVDLIHNVLDLIGGKLTDTVELVGCCLLVASALLAVAAFIGGLVDLSGKGIGKLFKFGCVCLFLLVMGTMACTIIVGAKIPGGFVALIVISALMILCTSLSSKKAKEKK